jgi:hypothetical protein
MITLRLGWRLGLKFGSDVDSFEQSRLQIIGIDVDRWQIDGFQTAWFRAEIEDTLDPWCTEGGG